MISRPIIIARRLLRSLVPRVAVFAGVIVLTALLAPLLGPLLPEAWATWLAADAVRPILTILATSMLTATTFSLSVMVQSFSAAQAQATPRAFRVLMQDTTTHTVLAVFTGAFLYALTSIVMFEIGLYDDSNATVALFLTVVVIGLIVAALLRWMAHLTRLGSMDHTLDMVVRAARPPLERAARNATLGAGEAGDAADGTPVHARSAGYLQIVDYPSLQETLEEMDAKCSILVGHGSYVVEGQALAVCSGEDEDLHDAILDAMQLGSARTMEQDARFGLVVLSEIALRALSPGVNDPGTAINVVHRMSGLLAALPEVEETEVEFDRIAIPPLWDEDLVQDALHSIIRDGAGRPDLNTHLTTALDVLEDSRREGLRKGASKAKRYMLEVASSKDLPGSDMAHLREKLRVDG